VSYVFIVKFYTVDCRLWIENGGLVGRVVFLNYCTGCPSYYGSECPVWGRSDAGSWWDWLVVVFVEGSRWRVRSGRFDALLGVDVFPARCRCCDGCLRLFHGRVEWDNHA